jgi:hypothetical protein
MTMRKTPVSCILVHLYRLPYVRKLALLAAKRLEGGKFYSSTLREILSIFHGVKVGAYSYGDCLIPGAFPAGVSVGRYVSIASGIRIFLRNHPIDRLSLHPFFYNSQLGWVKTDMITSSTLEIGDDAWIGDRVIITPGCWCGRDKGRPGFRDCCRKPGKIFTLSFRRTNHSDHSRKSMVGEGCRGSHPIS